MLCALPEPYYARHHQRRAAVGCVRIAFKWVFDGFRADKGCRGLDLYLEPTQESWIQHEVDILSHLGWEIGRFFAPVGLPTALATPRPLLAAVAPHRTLKGAARDHARPLNNNGTDDANNHNSNINNADDDANASSSGNRRGRRHRRRSPVPRSEPDGPPTGDHATVSLIPRRRRPQQAAAPSLPQRPLEPYPALSTLPQRSPTNAGHRAPTFSSTFAASTTTTTKARGVSSMTPTSAFYDDMRDDVDRQRDQKGKGDQAPAPVASMRGAAAPPALFPAARCRAASSDSERSARSRYANRTSAEARSMARASARNMSTSTGSVPRAVTQPLAFHVGM
ncbi:Ribonuclease H [Pandoravirus quercus]|uniref:Ribonuclease H n=1 Tax=Pandoravirus quercus TaxID=2107709 RepID=A0A2U7U8E9_9VIRU|nr:Ribonuclease H [Pandoravirus quercus]AVK74707.1 Ribonuclease H [Pandoravirus quercus]